MQLIPMQLIPMLSGVARRRRTVAICALTQCVLALCALAPLSAQSEALSLTEVISLHKQGVSARQILRNAETYCLGFVVNDSVYSKLTAAGVDANLIKGLSRSCSIGSVAPPQAALVASGPELGLLIDEHFAADSKMPAKGNVRGCTLERAAKGILADNRSRELGICVLGYRSENLPAQAKIELAVSGLGATRSSVMVLVFGAKNDELGAYSFSVTGDRRIELCQTSIGSCRRLVYLTKVDAINVGRGAENRVQVETRGREIILSINDVRVERYVADADVSGSIALGIGPGTRVLLTRLTAKPLAGSTAAR